MNHTDEGDDDQDLPLAEVVVIWDSGDGELSVFGEELWYRDHHESTWVSPEEAKALLRVWGLGSSHDAMVDDDFVDGVPGLDSVVSSATLEALRLLAEAPYIPDGDASVDRARERVEGVRAPALSLAAVLGLPPPELDNDEPVEDRLAELITLLARAYSDGRYGESRPVELTFAALGRRLIDRDQHPRVSSKP